MLPIFPTKKPQFGKDFLTYNFSGTMKSFLCYIYKKEQRYQKLEKTKEKIIGRKFESFESINKVRIH